MVLDTQIPIIHQLWIGSRPCQQNLWTLGVKLMNMVLSICFEWKNISQNIQLGELYKPIVR